MREILCFISMLIPAFLFSQHPGDTSSIEEPKYDTTSIDIRSINSFYFCSKLYRIPRDCNKKDESNCCSFSGQIHMSQKLVSNGQLGCYDGTTLIWTYFESEDQAKSSFEHYPPQIKKQMKKFKQTDIKLFICNRETKGYKITCTTDKGYTFYQIIGYANINGQPVLVQLDSTKDLNTSTQAQLVFQQIIQF